MTILWWRRRGRLPPRFNCLHFDFKFSSFYLISCYVALIIDIETRRAGCRALPVGWWARGLGATRGGPALRSEPTGIGMGDSSLRTVWLPCRGGVWVADEGHHRLHLLH
jgi:hypothetical protein